MSMGAIIEHVRDHLRSALSLAVDQCGVQIGGNPPQRPASFYVAIDEVCVESDAKEHLREIFEIEIVVWRRLGTLPSDRRGDAHLRDDPYLATLQTLDDLEQSVILAIHANYTDITAATNTALGTGAPSGGDIFQMALFYQGRKRSELFPKRSDQANAQWLGRRLRFRGMTRVQAIDVAR